MLDLDIDPRRPCATCSRRRRRSSSRSPAASTPKRRSCCSTSRPPRSARRSRAAVRGRAPAERRRARAIVLVSHKLEEVFAHCDTVTVLRDGRTVAESRAARELRRATRSSTCMVGRTPRRARGARSAPSTHRHPGARTAGRLHARPATATCRSSVHPGEIVGMYGLVGAGRTELAKAMLGLDRITDGRGAGRRQRRRRSARCATRCGATASAT